MVPETDEENRVDAAGSRLSEDAANVAVAVVSLAERDGDDAGIKPLVNVTDNDLKDVCTVEFDVFSAMSKTGCLTIEWA